MKISVQKSLLEQELKSICSVLTKGSILDPGRYVVVQVDQDELRMFVARPDLQASVSICKSGLLEIQEPGECALDGNFLLKMLEAATDDKLVLEFVPLTQGADDTLEDDDDSAPPDQDQLDVKKPSDDKVQKKSGTLTGSYLSSEEHFSVQTVLWSKACSLDVQGATIKSSGRDFSDLVKRVGIAAGDNKLDSDHTNVFIRGKADCLDLVTKTTTQLAWAKSPAEIQQECEIIVPYHLLKEAVGMLSGEALEASVVEKSDLPKSLYVRQQSLFGTQTVGYRTARICGTGIKFGSFESRLGQLDFARACKVQRSSLKKICDGLDVFQFVRTKVSYDPSKKKITFSKREANTVLKPLDVEDASGDPLDLDISSKHIKQAVSVCDEEQLKIEFSGKDSLVMVGVLDRENESYSRFRCYFMPF